MRATGSERLRLAIATPFNPHSAIAEVSLVIGRELRARGHDVAVIRTEWGDALELPDLDAGLPVWRPGDFGHEGMRDAFDLALVKVGDNFPYHAEALPILAEVPSVAIIHDSNLSNLTIGLEAAKHGASSLLPPPASDSPDEPVRRVASLATAAVVHGPHYRQTVDDHCPGPVRLIQLCAPPRTFPPRRRQPDRRFRITIFGMINPNKQADRVIRALASVPGLAAGVELHVIGTQAPGEAARLNGLARDLNVDPPVFRDGWIEETELHQTLADSDVICCLRYPVSEGGSASLITALTSGRPVIAARVASYSMIPDDLVAFVSYGERTDDLAQALVRLQGDPAPALQRAARAADWARAASAPCRYVDALEPLLERAVRLVPLWMAARQISRTLNDLGVAATDPAIQRIGITLEELHHDAETSSA